MENRLDLRAAIEYDAMTTECDGAVGHMIEYHRHPVLRARMLLKQGIKAVHRRECTACIDHILAAIQICIHIQPTDDL